ncbi:hypothetical protein [Nocardia asteroides]|uniref:hypothetical protein n=1 Tax=Nocardia asteroides TaxID=1824 RepID=UPI001E59D317|nr:hypothetical protein [Nocardia asteroides]UGT61571.1 hypothetical protein LTT61_31410 [Nocardia asteroides]
MVVGVREIEFERDEMALAIVVPILGPPAVGKTTLTLRLGADPRRMTFRLREHVPVDDLAATTSAADRLGWLPDSIVEPAIRGFLERTADNDLLDTVLLDNFPGTPEQVGMLVTVLADIAPRCALEPVELELGERARVRRAERRRVCHHCEQDPIADPRMPADRVASRPWTCARCGGLLHPRRGDAPSLFAARSRRHSDSTVTIREAFTRLGHPVTTLDADQEPAFLAARVEPMLISRSKAV